MSPNSQLEQDKRVRREIANSNERRRMQSINTGFQSLKILIPHSCGEKLSKVCYLQINRQDDFQICFEGMYSSTSG
jgi:transcription factor AP-4